MCIKNNLKIEIDVDQIELITNCAYVVYLDNKVTLEPLTIQKVPIKLVKKEEGLLIVRGVKMFLGNIIVEQYLNKRGNSYVFHHLEH